MRFGIACRDIVPPFRTKMYGYGARVDLYEDVNDPLTFTAIVLEDLVRMRRNACSISMQERKFQPMRSFTFRPSG